MHIQHIQTKRRPLFISIQNCPHATPNMWRTLTQRRISDPATNGSCYKHKTSYDDALIPNPMQSWKWPGVIVSVCENGAAEFEFHETKNVNNSMGPVRNSITNLFSYCFQPNCEYIRDCQSDVWTWLLCLQIRFETIVGRRYAKMLLKHFFTLYANIHL